MTRKHQSGPNSARPGSWVNCSARLQCRNQSLHINSDVLYPARKLHEIQTGEKLSRVSDLPLEAVQTYIDASEETKEKTVDALMIDVRKSNLAAKKRNPNLVITEAGYENQKRNYLSSHLPPEMTIRQPKRVTTQPVENKITKQNVYYIQQMMKDLRIEDKDERDKALVRSYSQLKNLKDNQQRAVLWAINDSHAAIKGTGLIQTLRGATATAAITKMVQASNNGNLNGANKMLDFLTKVYDEEAKKEADRTALAEAEKNAKEKAVAEKEMEKARKTAARESRKFSNRIKSLFR